MKRILLTSISAALLSSTLAMGNMTTVTLSGGTTSGGTVAAKAVFTTSANTVSVDLINSLTAAQMVDVAQALSDLHFTLTGTFASGLVSDTNRSYTGRLIDVTGMGVGTVSSDPENGIAANYNGWDFSNTGSVFTLEELGSAQNAHQLILGGTQGSSTPYPNANGSIHDNNGHTPFLQGDAVFTLTVAGVTANTSITAATFSFGTSPDNTGEFCTGCGTVVVQSVPEPRFVSLLLLGGMLLVAVYYRRRASVL
jgi:hypothetical protein